MRAQTRHRTNVAVYEGRPVSDEAAYWAGFLLADGWVRRKCPTIHLNLAVKDVAHIEAFRDFIMPTGEVKSTHGGRCAVLRVYGVVRLLPLLERFGIVERKSHGHPMPDLDEAEFWPFVRGFFDGDGHIGHHSSYWHIVFAGRGDFLSWLHLEIKSRLDVGGSLCATKKRSHRLAFCSAQARLLAAHLRGSPSLGRKQQTIIQATGETA